jgi:hypothetical protein
MQRLNIQIQAMPATPDAMLYCGESLDQQRSINIYPPDPVSLMPTGKSQIKP